MRFYYKVRTLFCYGSAFLLLSIISLNFGVNTLAFRQKNRVDALNVILVDLAYEPISLEIFTSWKLSTVIARVNTYIAVNNQLGKTKQYNLERDAIKYSFSMKVNEYTSKIRVFEKIDFSFLPTDLEKIEISVQREPEEYISSLKKSFRDAIARYNETAVVPLRWELSESEGDNMTIEEKLGQFVVISLKTYTLSETEKKLIANNHIGGVILYKQNIWDETQVKALTESIQQLSPKYPVFIAIDQEGGIVKRISWDKTLGQKQIAQLSESEQCNQFSQRSKLLAGLGINWNLGIVVDVTQAKSSFIFARTFSNDHDTVSTISARAAACTREVLTTLKHYPGHGATKVDTHLGLGIMSVVSEKEWLEKDARPFLAAKESDSIMTGHLIMPWIDSKQPASLSKVQIEYLRNSIGFTGLIVTDDIRMLESAGLTLSDAFSRAVVAGNDVILTSLVDDRRNAFLPLIEKLYASGTLTDSDVDARVKRILHAKNKIVHSYSEYVPESLVY